MRSYLYLLIIISFWGCTQNSTIEKYQNKRAHIINIHDKVKEINPNYEISYEDGFAPNDILVAQIPNK